MPARLRHQLVTRLVVASLLTAPVALTACAGHRVYDPYHGDYHRWSRGEDGYYRRWEGETGRAHVDINQRPAQEQHAYFDWRHTH